MKYALFTLGKREFIREATNEERLAAYHSWFHKEHSYLRITNPNDPDAIIEVECLPSEGGELREDAYYVLADEAYSWYRENI